VLALLVAAPSACGDASTSGRRVRLDLEIEGSPLARSGFVNARGWTVTLSSALVSTGAVYYHDGETLLSAASPGRRLFETLTIPRAFAHPGHYEPGNVKGEMLTGSSADLLSRTRLGAGPGISGPVRSATFSYGAPPTGPFAGALGAHVAVLEGVAEKGGDARTFRAEIDASDVASSSGKPEIVGCPFVEADVQGDGVVTATIHVESWLDQVDFADAADVIERGSLAHNQLTRGMKAALPYVFSFAPSPGEP
jgi:hypothetical protein